MMYIYEEKYQYYIQIQYKNSKVLYLKYMAECLITKIKEFEEILDKQILFDIIINRPERNNRIHLGLGREGGRKYVEINNKIIDYCFEKLGLTITFLTINFFIIIF